MDVDGVLTDGMLYYASSGAEHKGFHVHDGFGIRRAMEHGIGIALISSRRSRATAQRAAELGIPDVFQGVRDKEKILRLLTSRRKLLCDEVCFIGDDHPDLPALRAAGFSAAPADAVAEVRSAVDLVARAPSGHGAVREILDRVLKAKGVR